MFAKPRLVGETDSVPCPWPSPERLIVKVPSSAAIAWVDPYFRSARIKCARFADIEMTVESTTLPLELPVA